ncbi:MAG TPA: hypothetical protein VEQ38_00170 [Verrucomicrobiae bacterium]|nr:hypothetical protein [Verrucomicrobiae bacterium]
MLMSIASEAKLKIGRQSDFSLNSKLTRAESAAIHPALVCLDGKISRRENVGWQIIYNIQ